MDSLILAELLVLLALGAGSGVQGQLGATSVVHSQPLVWIYGSLAKRSLVNGLWATALAPRSGSLGGPVAIIRQTAPSPPPTTAPPAPAQPSK